MEYSRVKTDMGVAACRPGLRRGADASREGRRRCQLRPPARKASRFSHPFSVPVGAGGGRRRGTGPGGVFTSLSLAEQLRAHRQIHDMVVPDRHAPGAELAAGRKARAWAGAAGRRLRTDQPVRQIPTAGLGGAAISVRCQAGRGTAGDGRAARKATSRRTDAQVSRDGIFPDREGAGMLGIGRKIAAVPGL